MRNFKLVEVDGTEFFDMSRFTAEMCEKHNIVDFEMLVKLFAQGFNDDDVMEALETNKDTLDIDCYDEDETDYTACVSNCEEIARINTETRKLYVTKHISDLLTSDVFVTRKDTDVSDLRDLYMFCENEGVSVDNIEGVYEI